MSAETRSEDEGADAVKLMTLHAAKGLEFDTVLITGCEDELIPFKRGDASSDAAEHDEEVRLFYVGLTRAKRKLFLCRAFKRQRFGRTVYADPSPFLEVIRESLVGGKPPRARRAGMGINPADDDANDDRYDRYDDDDDDAPLAARRAALGGDSLAEHLRRTTGAKAATGGSPAFRKYAAGETGGYAKANAWKRRMNSAREGVGRRGGGGRGATREAMGEDDPEAAARRAARRASKGERDATRATKPRATGVAGRAGGPRAAPRRAAARSNERGGGMSAGGCCHRTDVSSRLKILREAVASSVDHADIPASSQNGPAMKLVHGKNVADPSFRSSTSCSISSSGFPAS